MHTQTPSSASAGPSCTPPAVNDAARAVAAPVASGQGACIHELYCLIDALTHEIELLNRWELQQDRHGLFVPEAVATAIALRRVYLRGQVEKMKAVL